MDIHILMSIVNMKLRDEFSSLASLCIRFEIDEHALIARLQQGGYAYEKEQNQFRDLLAN